MNETMLEAPKAEPLTTGLPAAAPFPAVTLRPKRFGWAFWLSVGIVMTLGFLILMGSMIHC